jgi:hypothetical protein
MQTNYRQNQCTYEVSPADGVASTPRRVAAKQEGLFRLLFSSWIDETKPFDPLNCSYSQPTVPQHKEAPSRALSFIVPGVWGHQPPSMNIWRDPGYPLIFMKAKKKWVIGCSS